MWIVIAECAEAAASQAVIKVTEPIRPRLRGPGLAAIRSPTARGRGANDRKRAAIYRLAILALFKDWLHPYTLNVYPHTNTGVNTL